MLCFVYSIALRSTRTERSLLHADWSVIHRGSHYSSRSAMVFDINENHCTEREVTSLLVMTLSFFISIDFRTYDVLSYIHLTERTIDCPTIISGHDDYIWILLRSTSNTLQAWHPSLHQLQATICLNKVFDRIGKPSEQLAAMAQFELNGDDDDEEERRTGYLMNEISISSFLIHETQLWIGTTMGILYVFEYSFTPKTVQSSSMSICRSYLAHMLPVKSLPRSLSVAREVKKSVDLHRKSRSQSDSCLWTAGQEESRYGPALDSFLGRQRDDQINLKDSVTTLTSVRTRSSSSVILSTDDSDQPSPARKHRRARSTATSAYATLALNLTFKAKIADTPVKCICRTR